MLALCFGASFVLVAAIGLAIYRPWSGDTEELDNTAQAKPPETKIEEPDPDAEAKAKAESEKNRTEFVRLMVDGELAASGNRLDEALLAYQAALKIYPEDKQAGKKLEDVRAKLDMLAKEQKDDAKNQTEFQQLLERGKEAMAKQQFAAAVEIYKLALQKRPGDARGGQALSAAQEALAQNEMEQQKLADFQKHINAAQSALSARRFQDAAGEATAARLLLPGNEKALDLLRQAEKALNAQKDQQASKTEFNRLLDIAGDSLRNNRFEEAVQAYEKALDLFPDDAIANKGWKNAQSMLKNAKAEFDLQIARGQNATLGGRFRDAVDAFREATRLFPSNQVAAKALRQAEVLLENQAAFVTALNNGTFALQASRHEEAILAFLEALRIVPNDPTAQKGLLDARKGLDNDVKNRKIAEVKYQQAQAALKSKDYGKARLLFNDVLKLVPNHPQLLLIGRQARYSEAMFDGINDFNAKRFFDAARNFQIALRENPGDPTALAWFNKVKGAK
ncbi:MAG: tetratricopeptide repeat protein [Gemmataceae bacterium]|nr:tetratricopeptide repeat protein [Gemmataceae bacterium]MCI0742406.1 tetratricopeptide repeat protein [Gemmataceae bacterium]